MDYSVQPVSLNELRSQNLSSANLSSTSHPAVRSGPNVNPQDPDSRVHAAKALHPVQDTVKISTTTQIEALKQTGNTVEQIAAKMNLSISEVEQVVGTTASSSSTTQASALAALSAKH